jgi:glutamate synthase (ferredoxin)
LQHFKKIIPNDYKRIKTVMKEFQDQGFTAQEAELKAFHQAQAS